MLNTRSKVRRADERRNEILEGALVAMRDHGLGGAGMREIARAAGLSTGNLYYYFRNKQELVYACQDRALDSAARRARRSQGAPRRRRAAGRAHRGPPARGHVGRRLPAPRARRSAEAALQEDRAEARQVRARRARPRSPPGSARAWCARATPKLQAFALLGALNWVARWYRPGAGDADEIMRSFREQLLRGLLMATDADPARRSGAAREAAAGADGQRRAARAARRRLQDAARGAARGSAAHRHQARLRARRVRRLRGAARRRAGAVVPGRRGRVPRARRRDRRGHARRGRSCIRCRPASPITARRSAATARPASCSRPRRCSSASPTPRAPRSPRRCRGSSAAAPATCRSSRRSRRPRR